MAYTTLTDVTVQRRQISCETLVDVQECCFACDLWELVSLQQTDGGWLLTFSRPVEQETTRGRDA